MNDDVHSSEKDPMAVKIGTMVLGAAAGWAAQQLVVQVWKAVSGKPAPKHTNDPDVSIVSAVTFAAVAAGVGVLARRLAHKQAQHFVAKSAEKSA